MDLYLYILSKRTGLFEISYIAEMCYFIALHVCLLFWIWFSVIRVDSCWNEDFMGSRKTTNHPGHESGSCQRNWEIHIWNQEKAMGKHWNHPEHRTSANYSWSLCAVLTACYSMSVPSSFGMVPFVPCLSVLLCDLTMTALSLSLCYVVFSV